MKHIDNLFKEKLYNHEAPVPEGMWEKIAPIAEEESGRALLWFWFAGAFALILGGYGIYKMITSDVPNDPSNLALQDQIEEYPNNLSVDMSLMENSDSSIEKEVLLASPDEAEPKDQAIEQTEVNSNKTKSSRSIKSKKASSSTATQHVSNTVENIGSDNGVHANLVITKSYINEDGSIIKQSNLSEDTGDAGPVYDVIINSEAKDVNAGALLRIVEPVESIPLPTLSKELKKKP